MLKIVKNHRDEDMVDLFYGNITWAVFHQDALCNGECGLGLHSRILAGETVEVVIVSREEYDKLNSE